MLPFAKYYYLLESSSSADIAERFINEVLSKYRYKDNLNCSWATIEFCKWAKDKGGDNKAIWFSWPNEETLKRNPNIEEAAHIAPIYKGDIIDFTYNQFTRDNTPYKITPVGKWAGIYQKFGVGADKHEGYPLVKIDDIDSLISSGYCQTVHAPERKSI